ncbi:hypothetical protein K435DRAFT_664095, partial [Dendrothele bispora CBS 962.96]
MTQCSQCGTPKFQPRVSINSDEILQQLRSSFVGFRDQARINSLLQDAEKDLDDYDTEIARLETAISVLKHKRACLEGHIPKFRSLLSPIRRLPPELLSLIFLWRIRCNWRGSIFNFIERGTELPPVVLSQVCSGWRQLAWSTPFLWSDLQIMLGYPKYLYEEFVDLIQPLIHLYFERSSQVPLDLFLSFDIPFTEDDNFEPIFKAIASTSPRWRSL